MLLGQNLLYLARKEQCLAFGTQLRKLKIKDYKIYRTFPGGEVQFLHPKDGVFPETSNEGRTPVGKRDCVELVYMHDHHNWARLPILLAVS